MIAVLHRDGPLPLAELRRRLGRPARDTLVETLDHLVASGVVARDARDLRYGLGPAGTHLGASCLATIPAVAPLGPVGLALKKWPMLVLVANGRGARHFNSLKKALPGITSGALAPALKDLEAAALMTRSLEAGFPPATIYLLTAAGEELFVTMNALVSAAESATAST